MGICIQTMPSLGPVMGLLLLLGLCPVVHGAKFDFVDTVLYPLTQISRRHAMYTKASSPSTTTSWEGTQHVSQVTMDVGFRVEPMVGATNDYPVELSFFHQDELENAQAAQRDGHFCCTQKTDEGYGCLITEQGKETIFVKTYTPIFRTQVIVPSNGTIAELLRTVDIDKTGMHYLSYSSCWWNNVDILLTGHNTWLNPYGYVPGELYYNIPFFLAMSLLYAIAALVWTALLIRYRNDGILKVQWGIGLLVLLGLIVVLLWYTEYNMYNQNGARSAALLTVAVCMSALKKTLGRVVMLAVCMGYGICRPHLGDNAMKLAAFGFVYCVFTSILDMVKTVGEEVDYSGGYFMLVVIPVATLDSLFYYWVFVSLYDVIAELEQTKQKRKLRLFKKFLIVIAVCLGCSFGWMVFQSWFLYSGAFLTIWQFGWMLDAYWYVLNFVLLVTVMALWRPSAHSMRYAYSLEVTADDDSDDGIEMDTSVGTGTMPIEADDIEADGGLPADI